MTSPIPSHVQVMNTSHAVFGRCFVV